MKASFLLALSSMQLLLAQPPEVEWSHNFGGDGSDSFWQVIPLSQGGFACAGSHERGLFTSELDWWLCEINGEGNEIWQRTYGTANIDVALSLTQTLSGGYLLCGYGDGQFNNAMTIRTADNGDSLSSSIFGTGGQNGLTQIIQTRDGGFALAGFKTVSGTNRDFWLIKLTAQGDSLWSRTYGGAGDEWCGGLVQTVDGGYALFGETQSIGAGEYDVWLVRTDAAGEVLWSRSYGSALDDRGSRGILQTADGGFALAGYVWDSEANSSSYTLLRVDANGVGLWSKSYAAGRNDWVNTLCPGQNGGFLVGGSRADEDTDWVPLGLLIRVDDEGDSLWSIEFEETSHVSISNVQLTADGGYVVAGYMTPDGAMVPDGWLMKLAPDFTLGLTPRGDRELMTFALLPSYPNPFNAATTIRFDLAASGPTQVAVHDLSGRKVAVLLDGYMSQGPHSIAYNAGALPSGSYFVRLVAGSAVATQKIVLVR